MGSTGWDTVTTLVSACLRWRPAERVEPQDSKSAALLGGEWDASRLPATGA